MCLKRLALGLLFVVVFVVVAIVLVISMHGLSWHGELDLSGGITFTISFAVSVGIVVPLVRWLKRKKDRTTLADGGSDGPNAS